MLYISLRKFKGWSAGCQSFDSSPLGDVWHAWMFRRRSWSIPRREIVGDDIDTLEKDEHE